VPRADERRSRPGRVAGAGLGGGLTSQQVLEQVLKETKKDGKSVGFLWSQGGDQFEMEEARDAAVVHAAHTSPLYR